VGAGIEDLNFEEMVQNIFWLASTSFSEDCEVELLLNNPESYSVLWESALGSQSPIHDNKKLTSKLS
jgi:hypothetical protein